MSLRLSIALPNHGILGGGTARGVQARGSNSAIVVVVVVVVVAPRVAFTDCLASVPSSRNRFPPSECYTPWYCYPPRRQRQRGSGGRSWLGVWDRNRPSSYAPCRWAGEPGEPGVACVVPSCHQCVLGMMDERFAGGAHLS